MFGNRQQGSSFGYSLFSRLGTGRLWCAALLLMGCFPNALQGDGKVIAPRNYNGSLEETGQEAIIIFRSGNEEHSAVEDLILKIRVEGDADHFAWVIPFPNPPETFKEDSGIFRELFDYVQQRKIDSWKKKSKGTDKKDGAANKAEAVEVISRKIVGDFEITVVRGKRRSWPESLVKRKWLSTA